MVQNIQGKLEIALAGPARGRAIDDPQNAAGNFPHVRGLDGELGEGLGGFDLVELLEVSTAEVAQEPETRTQGAGADDDEDVERRSG